MTKNALATVETLDAEAHDEALRLTEDIKRELRQLTSTFWTIGEMLRRVQDRKLYRQLGHESLRDYVEAELSVAVTQAYLMIRVVRSYIRADAERVGLERAASLIRYAKALGKKTDPGALIRNDAVIGEKPVSAASLREIEAARSAVEAERQKKKKRSPAERVKARQSTALIAHLRALAQQHDLGKAHIQVGEDEVVVRFKRDALAKRLGF